MSHDCQSRASIWPSTYVYILIYQTRRGYERTSVQKENFLPYPPPPGGQPRATQLLCPAGGFHGKSLYLRPTPYSRSKGVLSGSINLMPTPLFHPPGAINVPDGKEISLFWKNIFTRSKDQSIESYLIVGGESSPPPPRPPLISAFGWADPNFL